MGKTIINILISIAITLLFFACDDENKSVNPLTPEELSIQYQEFRDSILSYESNSIITLERTACFGTCPIYTVSIYENGNVEYFGKNFVEHLGKHNTKISSSQTDYLLNLAIEKNYLGLNDEYTSKIDTLDNGEIIVISISDLPTKITSIKYNGVRKKVRNYYGGPEWLANFEAKIDSTINVNQWIGNGKMEL